MRNPTEEPMTFDEMAKKLRRIEQMTEAERSDTALNMGTLNETRKLAGELGVAITVIFFMLAGVIGMLAYRILKPC